MSVLPKFSWPVPSNNRGSDFASQEDLMSHLEGEATGWYMVGSNGMWHGGIHITNTTTPWCALSGKAVSEAVDFPVPFKGEQSVRCMADGEVAAYRICRDYLTVPWETGPLNVSGSFVLVRHFIQPGEKKENGLHFYTLYMHLAPYSAYGAGENETHWIVNDKLPVFRREWVPDASAENRNKYRVATIPKGSRVEWDATEASRSATGPKTRRYGLVTFRGLSDKAKAKGTKISLVEGQQYWILTDRDNLVPSSGGAARPSWWAHLLPPYAEPMQFDTVTRTTIISPDPITVPVTSRSGFDKGNRVSLSQRATLGKTGKEACSRILLMLATDNPEEAEGWLPGGQIHTDLMVLLRVYMGYRSDVRVRLTVPVTILPEPRLGMTRRVQLGRTGVLGLRRDKPAKRTHLTVSLGTYEGLTCSVLPPAQYGDYRFE